jgi:hypothetical protein
VCLDLTDELLIAAVEHIAGTLDCAAANAEKI